MECHLTFCVSSVCVTDAGRKYFPLELSPADMTIAAAGSHHAQEAESQHSRTQQGSRSRWRSSVHVSQWLTLFSQLVSAGALCWPNQTITSAQTFKNHVLWSRDCWCAKQEADLHCGQGESIIPACWGCAWFTQCQLRDPCFHCAVVLCCGRSTFIPFSGRH